MMWLLVKFASIKWDEVIVWWYGEESSFSHTKVANVSIFSQNRCDAARVVVSDNVMMKYNWALVDLRD